MTCYDGVLRVVICKYCYDKSSLVDLHFTTEWIRKRKLGVFPNQRGPNYNINHVFFGCRADIRACDVYLTQFSCKLRGNRNSFALFFFLDT